MEQYKTQEMFSQEELEMVATGLERDLDLNPVTRLYYDQFVREGLPILRTAHAEFDTKAWIAFTGHPFAAVEVYETNGTLKYSIPSMIDNLETPVGNPEDRFCDHIQELLSLRADNPMLASRSVFHALNQIVGNDTEAHAESAAKTIVAVNKVFADHGIPLLSVADFTQNPSDESDGAQKQIDVSYQEHPIGGDFEEL